ncbi:MAG: NUDIX domain-containing protein [Ruminococcaceae bacterium]|nr:NUDIX domain-containing protein [Oscillospiraceae bacterium]
MTPKQRNMTTIFLESNGKILLLYREGGRVVNHVWVGCAGGHMEPEELNDAAACVLRELEEELGITPEEITDVKLRYLTTSYAKGEIRLNYYFFAKLPDGQSRKLSSNEGELRWFAPEEIPELSMAFTAHFVMEHYFKVGQYTSEIYGGVANRKNVVFVPMPERE